MFNEFSTLILPKRKSKNCIHFYIRNRPMFGCITRPHSPCITAYKQTYAWFRSCLHVPRIGGCTWFTQTLAGHRRRVNIYSSSMKRVKLSLAIVCLHGGVLIYAHQPFLCLLGQFRWLPESKRCVAHVWESRTTEISWGRRDMRII